jgi:hypothetical protein
VLANGADAERQLARDLAAGPPGGDERQYLRLAGVSAEFLEPATAYLWEVLAIEESGNQTLSSSAFRTR